MEFEQPASCPKFPLLAGADDIHLALEIVAPSWLSYMRLHQDPCGACLEKKPTTGHVGLRLSIM
jgi:hypothetical protein